MGNQELIFSEELLQLAESGDPQAQYQVAVCYQNGLGVTSNMAKAVEWYQKSAEQGYAEAQCSLGHCYEDGGTLPQNFAEALKWYALSAQQGYAPAEYSLGLCYLYGRGVAKNRSTAINWIGKVADKGDKDAKKRCRKLAALELVSTILKIFLAVLIFVWVMGMELTGIFKLARFVWLGAEGIYILGDVVYALMRLIEILFRFK